MRIVRSMCNRIANQNFTQAASSALANDVPRVVYNSKVWFVVPPNQPYEYELKIIDGDCTFPNFVTCIVLEMGCTTLAVFNVANIAIRGTNLITVEIPDHWHPSKRLHFHQTLQMACVGVMTNTRFSIIMHTLPTAEERQDGSTGMLKEYGLGFLGSEKTFGMRTEREIVSLMEKQFLQETIHTLERKLETLQKNKQELEEKYTCVICYQNERAVLPHECKHFAVCVKCLPRLLDTENKYKCPVCRCSNQIISIAKRS